MIKSITLTNFRSHEDTELEFSPHVNVIVGKSDSGKSNIIRALNWIVTNRPLGENVIQYGKEQAMVQVVVEDNGNQLGVTRMKKKSKNEYILSTDKENISFEAFGSSPPESVLEALNLSNVNIQKQNEQYFLIFDSPGQVATYIRSITKLDEVDKVVKLLASKVRSKTGQISNYQVELKEVEQELDEISKIDLDDFEQKINEIHSFIKANEQFCRKQDELASLLLELKKVEKSIICFPINTNQVLQDCDSISKLYEELLNKKTDFVVLLTDLEKIQKIVLPKDIKGFLDINNIILKYNNICKEVKELTFLIQELEKGDEKISNFKGQFQLLKDEEKQLISQLDICPYCGQVLSREAQKTLIEG